MQIPKPFLITHKEDEEYFNHPKWKLDYNSVSKLAVFSAEAVFAAERDAGQSSALVRSHHWPEGVRVVNARSQAERENHSSYEVNKLRGNSGVVFGEEALRETLHRLKLKMIIRGHQVTKRQTD